jgi:hypothetical protein
MPALVFQLPATYRFSLFPRLDWTLAIEIGVTIIFANSNYEV